MQRRPALQMAGTIYNLPQSGCWRWQAVAAAPLESYFSDERKTMRKLKPEEFFQVSGGGGKKKGNSSHGSGHGSGHGSSHGSSHHSSNVAPPPPPCGGYGQPPCT